MTNRREFLQTAAAILAAAPVVGPAASYGSLELPMVVVDTRFPEGLRFGSRAQAAGCAVHPIQGDPTSLWFEELSARWADRPVPVSGLTRRPALFCLEQLAWDHRMRVVYHAEHRRQPNGTVLHSAGIPPAGVDLAKVAASGGRWPEFMADALTGGRFVGRGPHGPSSASMPTTFDQDQRTLHTWVIAPVACRARARA